MIRGRFAGLSFGAAIVIGAVTGATPASAATGGPPAPLSSYVVTVVPGFTVSDQGTLAAHRFVSYAPDPAAVTASLGRLSVGGSSASYLRSWSTPSDGSTISDVVVSFSRASAARAFVTAARGALPAGGTSTKLTQIRRAVSVTYPSPYPPASTERVVLFNVSRTAVIVGASEPGASVDNLSAALSTLAERQDKAVTASPYGRAIATVSNTWRVVIWTAVGLGVVLVGVVVWLFIPVGRHRRSSRRSTPATAPTAEPVLGPVGSAGEPAPPAEPEIPQRQTTPPPGTPAGWRLDPYGPGDRLRYFDGSDWTSYVAVRA